MRVSQGLISLVCRASPHADPPTLPCCHSLKCISYQSVLEWLLSCARLTKPPNSKVVDVKWLPLSHRSHIEITHIMAPSVSYPTALGCRRQSHFPQGKWWKENLSISPKPLEVCGVPACTSEPFNLILWYNFLPENTAWGSRWVVDIMIWRGRSASWVFNGKRAICFSIWKCRPHPREANAIRSQNHRGRQPSRSSWLYFYRINKALTLFKVQIFCCFTKAT